MFLIIAFSALLAYIILYYNDVRRYPKGPLPLPFIGNLYHVKIDNLHLYLHELGKEYGHCFTLFIPTPVVIFTNYSTINEALVIKGEHFAGRSHTPPETLLQKVPQTGVVISDGDVWKEQRRTSLRILRDLGVGKNVMEGQINRSIDELLEQLKATNDEKTPYDMNLPIQLCVGNIINESLFGYHFKYNDTKKFEYFLSRVNKHMQTIRDNIFVLLVGAYPWMRYVPIIGRKGYDEPIANVSQYQDFIEEEVGKIAEKFDEEHEPTNFVESYLAEMKRNPGLDMTNLYAIGVDFWLAGMETTSTTLRWAILFLMKFPHVQDRVRCELQKVVGVHRRVEMSDKPKLPYFTATIAEIQRYANMVTFLGAHRCTADMEIAGKFIPKDTITMPQIYSVLKDDEAFEDNEEFRPERFLEDDGKAFNKKQMERMIAFGLGKRQCVGEGLARMELFLVLATLILHYRFEPVAECDLTPVFSAVLLPRPYKCRVVSV